MNKNNKIELIESIGYMLKIKQTGGDFFDINLVDGGEIISKVKTRRISDTFEEIESMLSGNLSASPDSSISSSIDHLFIRATVHALNNEKIDKFKTDELLSHMNKFDQKYVLISLKEKESKSQSYLTNGNPIPLREETNSANYVRQYISDNENKDDGIQVIKKSKNKFKP